MSEDYGDILPGRKYFCTSFPIAVDFVKLIAHNLEQENSKYKLKIIRSNNECKS